MTTWYSVLRLEEEKAEQEKIKSAYKERALECHKMGFFQQLIKANLAYEILLDPKKKKEYDENLSVSDSKSSREKKYDDLNPSSLDIRYYLMSHLPEIIVAFEREFKDYDEDVSDENVEILAFRYQYLCYLKDDIYVRETHHNLSFLQRFIKIMSYCIEYLFNIGNTRDYERFNSLFKKYESRLIELTEPKIQELKIRLKFLLSGVSLLSSEDSKLDISERTTPLHIKVALKEAPDNISFLKKELPTDYFAFSSPPLGEEPREDIIISISPAYFSQKPSDRSPQSDSKEKDDSSSRLAVDSLVKKDSPLYKEAAKALGHTQKLLSYAATRSKGKLYTGSTWSYDRIDKANSTLFLSNLVINSLFRKSKSLSVEEEKFAEHIGALTQGNLKEIASDSLNYLKDKGIRVSTGRCCG